MPVVHMTLVRLTFSMLALQGALAHAAPPAADGPPDDLDALSLADKAPAPAAASAAPRWRAFVEGAAGLSRGTERFDTGRASFDLRYDDRIAPGLRAVLSDRLDLLHYNGADSRSGNTNTLREAYLSWTAADDVVVDLGRVNIRRGAAWGYNPTDFFRGGSLRFVSSPDPAQLRENRQGTFVLQGQKLWSQGALTAAYSPKLANPTTSASNPATFALDAGATNPRHRWLLAGSYKVSERFNPELLAYGGVDTPTQLGVNLSTVLGDATVLFGEFSAGRGRSLLAQALAQALAGAGGAGFSEHEQRRGAFGLTYTTAFNLSVTAEAEFNSAAPSEAQWRALPTLGPATQLQVLGLSQTLQELPVRRASFVYAVWKDAFVRRFDLSAFIRHEGQTSSRHQWLEARYRWDRADLSLQMQWFSGAPGSVYGSVPQRRSVELALRAYL